MWIYYVYIYKVLVRSIAVFFALLSAVIIWSEVTFQFHNGDYSIFTILVRKDEVGNGMLEMISMGVVVYMCVCAYSSLLKVRKDMNSVESF